MLVDQGSEFGNLFIGLATASNVEVQKTGIESHSSLGLCERYHQPLRTIYRRIMVTHPDSDRQLALALAVKAMNDTLGPEGYVPSVLVFGEYPRVHTKSEKPPPKKTLSERSKIAALARKECESIMAKMKVDRALRHRIPPNADHKYDIGSQILIWRERVHSNRIGEWMGPFKVIDVNYDAKQVFVRDCKVGPARPFSLWQVKPYYDAETVTDSLMCDINKALTHFRSPVESFHTEALLTEILHPWDPRSNGPEMTEAKKKEICGLLERGAFKVILKEEVPKDANVLPIRFVLAIKSSVDGNIVYKARYVIGGHCDKYKDFIVHSSTTLQPHSIRPLLALSRIFGFEIWTSDVRQIFVCCWQ